MNIIRKFVLKLLEKDPIAEIFTGEADQNKYYQAVHWFQELPDERKRELFKKILVHLDKGVSQDITLSLLILCDFLAATNPNIYHEAPQILFSDLKKKSKVRKQILIKKEKNQKGYTNFMSFYLEFLFLKIWSYQEFQGINSIYAGVNYFQHALQAMKLFLKLDFVIQFCLINLKKNKRNLIVIATENILRRISEDLQLLTKFVNKWIHAIFEQNNESFLINKIYEQLVYIGKNTNKFEYISKKLELSLNFEKYAFNRQLNTQIEKEMLKRHKERKKFFSRRNDGYFSDISRKDFTHRHQESATGINPKLNTIA